MFGVSVRRVVAVNERGIRLGEDHQRAKLTNAEVDLIRELHEDGMSYAMLAAKFGVSKSSIADICRYRRRAQIPTAWREVRITAREPGEN